MNHEVARHWRGQEQRYLGPNGGLLEYQQTQHAQTGQVLSRHLRNKLQPRIFELPSGHEAEVLVEQLRQQRFNDEAIARTGIELAAMDSELGLLFAAEVLLKLKHEFNSEPERIEVMRNLGYTDQGIIDWHMSVDGYSADTIATERLRSQVLG